MAALQDRMATLSTNSSHRVVPWTHDALITDQTAAQTSSQAIHDVVHAVRFTASLGKSSYAKLEEFPWHTLSDSFSRWALHGLRGA